MFKNDKEFFTDPPIAIYEDWNWPTGLRSIQLFLCLSIQQMTCLPFLQVPACWTYCVINRNCHSALKEKKKKDEVASCNSEMVLIFLGSPPSPDCWVFGHRLNFDSLWIPWHITKQKACCLPGLHVWHPWYVCTLIKMQSPSEYHGNAYFISANIDLALKQTK